MILARTISFFVLLAGTVHAAPLLAKSHRFLAAPKPPGRTMASKAEASSRFRGVMSPREMRADSASMFLVAPGST
jgi:hypothetical protein